MWHVADGDLHAYLDGALEFYPPRQAKRIREHMERCTECRRRLEEDARLAGSARALLAEASPAHVVAPPLEELRRRADVGVVVVEEKRRRSWSRVGWAWAATVVLALGIGWGVGAWPFNSNGSVASRTRAGSPSTPAGQTEAPPAQDLAARGTPRVASEDAPSTVQSDALGERESAPPPSVQVAEASKSGDESPAANSAKPAGAAAADQVASLGVVERRSAPELSPGSLAPDVPGRISTMLDAPVTASAPQEVAPTGAPAPRAEAPEVSRRRTDASSLSDRPAVAQNRLSIGPTTELRLSAGAPGGDDATRMREARRGAPELGTGRIPDAPFVIEGLVTESVEWRGLGNNLPGILVRQRNETTRVELHFFGKFLYEDGLGSARDAQGGASAAAFTRADSPPDAIANMRVLPGWNQIVRPFRGGWVVIRAPLPADRLSAMLAAAGVQP
jgi:hypothetical protein